MGRVKLPGHASRPSMARSGADVPVGSRSQEGGTRVAADRIAQVSKNQLIQPQKSPAANRASK